jgi:hypothetical protein
MPDTITWFGKSIDDMTADELRVVVRELADSDRRFAATLRAQQSIFEAAISLPTIPTVRIRRPKDFIPRG